MGNGYGSLGIEHLPYGAKNTFFVVHVPCMQFITAGGVGEEEGEQARGIDKEETRELIYIDVEPGRKIGRNLDLEREIGQNLDLERGFDDSVDLERGLEQKARALQQAEEATMTGGAYLIP